MLLKCKSLEMLRGANEQQSLCFHLKKPKPETKAKPVVVHTYAFSRSASLSTKAALTGKAQKME